MIGFVMNLMIFNSCEILEYKFINTLLLYFMRFVRCKW